MGSYKWHWAGSCCKLSAPWGVPALSTCLSVGIAALLWEWPPCVGPERLKELNMMLRSKSQVNLGCTEVWQGCLMSQIPKDREKGGSSAHWHKELLLLLPLTEQHPFLPSHHSPMSLHSRNTVFKPTEKKMSCLQSSTISPDSKKTSKQTNKNDQPGDPH